VPPSVGRERAHRRTTGLKAVAVDADLVALRLLADRRERRRLERTSETSKR
jgi:hypothetical protein